MPMIKKLCFFGVVKEYQSFSFGLGIGNGMKFHSFCNLINLLEWTKKHWLVWTFSTILQAKALRWLCKMDGYPLSSAHPSIEQWALLMYEGIFIPLHKSFRSTKALLLYIYYVYVYIQVYRPVYSLVSIDTRLMYVYYVYIHMYMLKHIHIYMFKS